MIRYLTLTVLSLTLVLVVPGHSAAKGAKGYQGKKSSKGIEFEGKLQNARRRPVSGVFPMKFSLYRGPKGGKSIWSENHFVAVDSGRYLVSLGKAKKIKKSIDLSKMYLGVSYAGGGEIQRERIEIEDYDPAAAANGTATSMQRVAATTRGTTAPTVAVRTSNGRTTVDYAEEAGMATYAQSAESAKRIGELDEKDLLKRLDARSSGKVSVGTKVRFSASAGGEGGSGYDLQCPKGTVVTGVRGTAGIYLDSIQLICSPLE